MLEHVPQWLGNWACVTFALNFVAKAVWTVCGAVNAGIACGVIAPLHAISRGGKVWT